MNDLYIQFISIAIIHIFAVMSPGPDFAIIVKQSISHGRKAALTTSVGIGTGILMHITLCMLGLAIIIASSNFLLHLIKILGASYLMYIGIKSIIDRNDFQDFNIHNISKSSTFESFKLGFLTNLLNPKATLFFLSLYGIIISGETTLPIQALYGIWMAIITTLWFSFLSIVLTKRTIIQKIQNISSKIQIGTGVILIIFAFKLLFSN